MMMTPPEAQTANSAVENNGAAFIVKHATNQGDRVDSRCLPAASRSPPAALSISHWRIRQRWMELNMVFWERGQDRGFIPNLRPWYTGPGG